jgi:4-aminobutyrate aminotransferase-like enzyme
VTGEEVRRWTQQRYSNTITLSPPLVITRGEIDRIVETLNRAIAMIPAAMAS